MILASRYNKSLILLTQWILHIRWYDHVVRKEGEDTTKKMITMQVHRKRIRGMPKKKMLDNIREDMKEYNMSEAMAENRSRPYEAHEDKYRSVNTFEEAYMWECETMELRPVSTPHHAGEHHPTYALMCTNSSCQSNAGPVV